MAKLIIYLIVFNQNNQVNANIEFLQCDNINDLCAEHHTLHIKLQSLCIKPNRISTTGVRDKMRKRKLKGNNFIKSHAKSKTCVKFEITAFRVGNCATLMSAKIQLKSDHTYIVEY